MKTGKRIRLKVFFANAECFVAICDAIYNTSHLVSKDQIRL